MHTKELLNKQQMSKKMDEFLDKVDKLCFEYDYEILPNPNKLPNESYTLLIKGGNNEEVKILFIDGDGRGK